MNKASFLLTISKVHELIFKGEVISTTLPGTEGEFTVLSGHEPLITLLKKGEITVRMGDEMRNFSIEKGVCEISHGQVTVLV